MSLPIGNISLELSDDPGLTNPSVDISVGCTGLSDNSRIVNPWIAIGFLYDYDPPYLDGVVPQGGATDVSRFSTIYFSIKDDSGSINADSVLIKINNSTIWSNDAHITFNYDVVKSSIIDGLKYVISAVGGSLGYGQTYTIYLEARDNSPQQNSVASTWTFTTEDAPVVTSGYNNLQHMMEVGPLIGSGVLSYNTPVVSARTEAGQEAAPAAIGSYSQYTTTAHPSTGNAIEGWHWDERVWSGDGLDNTAMFVPINWDPSTTDITTSYFQSGIGSNEDLKLESIQLIPSSGLNLQSLYNLWAPEVKHGYYYNYNVEDYLFSDDSEIATVTYSGVVQLGGAASTGYNEVTLNSRPKVGVPIKVRQLEWDNDLGKYSIVKDLRKRVAFTGILNAENTERSTFISSTNTIIWDNIDQTVEEFVVVYSGVNPKVILNGQYVEEVGSNVVPSGLETIGTALGTTSQQYHTQYAPIDSTLAVNVYSYVAPSGTPTQWEAISFGDTPQGYQVKVDYDLGILEFGDTSLSGQLAPNAGDIVGINYSKTLFAEYEPHNAKDTVLATEANVNSIYRRSSKGFVYLTNQLAEPASITLRAELPEIQSNVFGPVAIGNTFVPLVATVKDANGLELEDQSITFSINSVPTVGSFGSSSTTISTTDELGQARAFFNAPQGIEDIGEEVTASGWSVVNSPAEPQYTGMSQITKLHTTSLAVEGIYADIFLYETHTDDLIQGYWDSSVTSTDDAQLSNYYTSFFDEHEIQGSTRDVEWEHNHRLVWNLARPTLFAANAGLGRRQLVSIFDSTALNPHTFEAGATVPVRPVYIEGADPGEYDIVYNTSTNPIPEPTASATPTPNGTLYSYFVVTSTTVRLQASVYNPRLNSVLSSDEIFVKFSIPSYLSGVWILDSINQSHIDEVSSTLASVTASGQHVPLGFRLKSSSVTLAAALNGVTFLDVNVPPRLSQQFNLNTIT